MLPVVPSIIRRGIIAALLALSACASETRKDVDLSDVTSGGSQGTGPMKAAEIMQALSNKSFKYTRGADAGVITFASDGTFVYQENGKGEGTGVWQASEGQLCSAYNPTSFLPQGTRSECRPITWVGGAYAAGDTRYQPV